MLNKVHLVDHLSKLKARANNRIVPTDQVPLEKLNQNRKGSNVT